MSGTCSLELHQHQISSAVASEGNFIHCTMKSRVPTITSKLRLTQTRLCCAHEMRVTPRRLCLPREERLFVTHGAALRSTSFYLLKRTGPQINKFPSAAPRAAASPCTTLVARTTRPCAASPLIWRITSSASSSSVAGLRCRAEVHHVYAS